MKTAESWVDIETGNVFFHAQEDSVSDEDWIELVKQIQLDAYRAGMTQAAEICKSRETESDLTVEAHWCKQAILTARDKKTL